MSATEVCSQCNTSKKVVPSLRLLYSTCCGRELCSTCVSKIPSRSGTRCTLCHQPVTNRDFTGETLESQLYNKELNVKQRLSTIFMLQSIDFPTVIEYEDYNELVSDIMYELVYGNKSEQDHAEKKIQEWKSVNQNKIDQASKRQQQSIKQQKQIQTNKNNENKSNDDIQPINELNTQNNLNFALPSVNSSKHSLYISKHDEASELQRIKSISDSKQRNKLLSEFRQQKKLAEEKSSVAGGLNIVDDKNRSLNEAMYCLFDFD